MSDEHKTHEELAAELQQKFDALQSEAEIKLAVAFRTINTQNDRIYELEVALEAAHRVIRELAEHHDVQLTTVEEVADFVVDATQEADDE